MEKTYGKHYLRNLGPGLVMGTAVRDRIVKCARFSKIHTVADLETETKWDAASEHGAAIIAIIMEHYPIPDPASIVTPNALSQQSNIFIPNVFDIRSHVPHIIPNGSQQSISFVPYMAGTHSDVPPVVPYMPPHQEATVRHARVRQEPTCSACHKKGHTSTLLSLKFLLTLMRLSSAKSQM